jgi:hypothetical protein
MEDFKGEIEILWYFRARILPKLVMALSVECLESLNFLWFWQNDLLDGFIDLVLSRD